MNIDVFFRGELLGTLERRADVGFVFTYAPLASESHRLSIHMPSTQRMWTSRTLFPIFQVSHPEGFLEKLLEQRLQCEDSTAACPLQLLLESGVERVGGLTLIPHGHHLSAADLPWATGEVPRNADDLRSHLQRVPAGRLPGISGGFPKCLHRRPNTGMESGDNSWIIKLNDEDHPELTILEFFGMEVARRMGLPTAEVHLNEDAQILYVKRFDLAEDRTLQFEDMCSLLGLPSRDKYASSIERVANALKSLPPTDENRGDCATLYAQYLLAATIRNGDAHLKNFGLLYEPGVAPRLSPVYDMLSMGVYAPPANNGDAFDGMALTLRGSRRWPREADLSSLAALCGVSRQEHDLWCDRMSHAVITVSAQVVQFCRTPPAIAAIPKLVRMIELWAFGCTSLAPKAAAAALSNSRLIRDLP
ncbi:type II toxin-antitoxin system HipA family toxin [Achromobacter sp. NPDC058515]|uniref:type II toxin-antitoxin system HipA family toxin n=1 Tax=Achromobacter sp. NPDC058515 TaxID=3346533 RepID=UPI00364EB49C